MTNLRNLSDIQLLELTQRILAEPHSLTIAERKELLMINDEFIRRDAARASDMCSYCYELRNGGPRCSNCGGL